MTKTKQKCFTTSDEFCYPDEETKASSENIKVDEENKDISVDKPSEYRVFIEEQQTKALKKQTNLT